MTLMKLVISMLAGISIAVMYALLWVFVPLAYVLETAVIVIDAVSEFLDYHVTTQRDLINKTWGNE